MSTFAIIQPDSVFSGVWDIPCANTSTSIASKDYNILICGHIMELFNKFIDISPKKYQTFKAYNLYVPYSEIESITIKNISDLFEMRESDYSITIQTLSRIDRALSGYQVINYDEVNRYLFNKPDLIDLIDEIPSQFHNYFHDDDITTIEMFEDPEEPGAKYINIKIITREDIHDPFERLASFEVNWLFKKIQPFKLNIIFDIGYR